MSQPSLDDYVHQPVVLDTQGPLLFVGILESWSDRGYWLTDADVHDRNDGHSTKEVYVNQAFTLEQEGARHVNRRRVFVEREAVVCISLLQDVVTGMISDRPGEWMP